MTTSEGCSIFEQYPILLENGRLVDSFKMYAFNDYNDQKKWADRHRLTSIETCEELRYCLNNILEKYPVSSQNTNFNFAFCRGDTIPFWETKENINGGRWTFQIYMDFENLERSCNYIDTLIIRLICEFIDCDEDIFSEFTCFMVTIKASVYKIAVWNRNHKNTTAVDKIGKLINDALTMCPTFKCRRLTNKLDYGPHPKANEILITRNITVTFPPQI